MRWRAPNARLLVADRHAVTDSELVSDLLMTAVEIPTLRECGSFPPHGRARGQRSEVGGQKRPRHAVALRLLTSGL